MGRAETVRDAFGGAKVADTTFASYKTNTYKLPTKFVRGGWCVFDSDRAPYDLQGCMGWQGYGGACCLFHPGLDVSIGFAKDLLHLDFENISGGVDGGEIHPV